MVQLYEITVLAQKVQLKLLLESEYRQEVVETVYPAASENELMIFEQIVSVLVYIYLELRVGRMLCKSVMV